MRLALFFVVLVLLLDHYVANREARLARLLLEIDLGAVNGLALFLALLLGGSRGLYSVALALLQVLLEADFGAGLLQGRLRVLHRLELLRLCGRLHVFEQLLTILVFIRRDNTIHASLLTRQSARAGLVPALEVARGRDAVIVHLAFVLRFIAALLLSARVAAGGASVSRTWALTTFIAIICHGHLLAGVAGRVNSKALLARITLSIHS